MMEGRISLISRQCRVDYGHFDAGHVFVDEENVAKSAG